jgi:membrane protein YdbS with pleckstrin-like domain
MKHSVGHATAWIYSGIWGVMTRWFRVPEEPPRLPSAPNERIESLRPAPGFLAYLKFQFWLVLILIDVGILMGWLMVFFRQPSVGLVLAPVAFAIAVLPDVAAYVAIHLRYDTTWYVMSSRSLRIRRGILLIHETTITFENIQNVRVEQGPLQRYFGIADLIVETAGGGGGSSEKGKKTNSPHRGLMEGVADATMIRDRILQIVRQSRSAGLGDDHHEGPEPARRSAAEIVLLREIRDALRAT